MNTDYIIKVARGIEPADLVIKNASIINVFTEEICKADVAIAGEVIAGVGQNYKGRKEIDAEGKYLSPGFIDGHVHIESSTLLPSQFAKAVLPAGTTTLITDPHEISNVFGLQGISFMHECVKDLPVDVYTMLPSCVPASPYETSGFELNDYDLSLLLDSPWVLGIAEMMNYPGVLNLDKCAMSKIKLGLARNKRIDGHAPGLSGKDLCAYIAAGITSDHETTGIEEAKEKLAQGMYLMVREGSAAKDLNVLIPLLKNINTRKCMFVTDDRHPADLQEHINLMVKKCVEYGVSPVKAVQMASLNTAEYFNIRNLGAIAPGYLADILILDNLTDFKPEKVFKKGKLVAQNGRACFDGKDKELSVLRGSVNVKWIEPGDFKIPAASDHVKAIEIIPGRLITKAARSKIKLENGYAQANTDGDILKILVFERHKASGNIGKGFVKGFGLKSGAIASTVAHDSHNMMVIGADDADMYMAAVELVKAQGGKIVVDKGRVVSMLPLPIAGLMSTGSFEEVVKKTLELKEAAANLGCKLDNPFMNMAFLSLSVIPEIKITDKGVFDVSKSEFIDIFK